jgi:uncharacterized lipoprotein YddW (UPF0748 family)
VALGGAPRPAPADPAPDLTAATAAIRAALDSAAGVVRTAGADSGSSRLDYLWVVRWTLTDSQKVERAVERAQEMGVRGLLVQVVGRGDAHYRSDILPRAEALAGTDFDPLGLVTARAHAAGLEVHAWVNCMLVWSLSNRPRDPRHVVNAHPEWVARLADGRPMTRMTDRQRRRLGVEGAFLSPAHPGVRAWLASVVKEIAERYAVDGVHLDYIRLPGVRLLGEAGSPLSGTSADGTVVPGTGGRSARVAWSGPGATRTDAERAHVSAVVQDVRDSLDRVRPSLPLSAAVVADTATAEGKYAQPWTTWLRRGFIGRAFAMCYAKPLRTVLAQLTAFTASPGTGGRVVPGIAVYNTPPATAAAKIRAARTLGFPELAIYSYDALERSPGYWPRLRGDLGGAPAAATGAAR